MTTNKKAPIQTFKDGAVTIKLWEQNAGGNIFVNASVGRIYKDKTTGEFGESKSFSNTDLLKLQAIIPQVREEMQKWHDYYREVNQQQAQSHDMTAQRDAVMQQAVQTQAPTEHTQEHSQENIPEYGR